MLIKTDSLTQLTNVNLNVSQYPLYQSVQSIHRKPGPTLLIQVYSWKCTHVVAHNRDQMTMKAFFSYLS